jgi:UDP-3-O-[3-hydroxymyristoyl] N-acetylglucosamine deacetylase
MDIVQQRTVKNSIHCRGVGLHSGVKTSLTLLPAPPDTGIVFRRTDAAGAGAEITAHWTNAIESALCTTLTNGEGIVVATVEHLMAAFAGAELDNVIVEIDGPEVPIMDGSAAPFVFLIECAGLREQDAARRAIKILKPVTVGDTSKSAALLPDHGFSMSFEIDFASRAVNRQDISIVFDSETFKSEIARARTFGFLHDLDRMRAAGLARGGSLDNAVVVSGDIILNEGGLRYTDEFVRHKLLDALGDCYLAGHPLIGHFRGQRSGHSLNRQILEALFADPDAWCFTTLSRSETLDDVIWREPVLARA